MVAPRLPGCLETQGQGQQAEVGNDGLGQESGAESGGDGDDEDGGEAKVLAQEDPRGGAAVSGALREEQRQDHDVVDVGDGEQAGGLPDDARRSRGAWFLSKRREYLRNVSGVPKLLVAPGRR